MEIFTKVRVYILSLVISMIALIVISTVKTKIQSYRLHINKLAFFRLDQILINQIPSYQALVFAVYIPFAAYYLWNHYQERKQKIRIQNGVATFEEKYYLEVESKESKEWSNILLTNLFIYLTQVLALILAIFFCAQSISEINYVKGQYENTPNSDDRDTIESVDDLKQSLRATIALNSICLVQIFFNSFKTCLSKIKTK